MNGCGNCGRATAEHCQAHVIPCCPGRCAGQALRAAPSWPVAAAPPGGVVITVTRNVDGTFNVFRRGDA